MCYNVEQHERKLDKYHAYNSEPVQLEIDFHVVSGFSFPKLWVESSEKPGELSLMRWGLVPSWCKDVKKGNDLREMTLNARSETVFEKPSFRSISRKRCLLPVQGFYEWRTVGANKYPYYIHLKDQETFLLGCLFDTWTRPDTGEAENTFSIVTTEANPLMAKIHNSKKRMPLILPDELSAKWLDTKLGNAEVMELMKPFDQNKMTAHTISKLITSKKENRNQEKVKEPFTYPELQD